MSSKKQTEPLAEIVASFDLMEQMADIVVSFAQMGPYAMESRGIDVRTGNVVAGPPACAFCNLRAGHVDFEDAAMHEEYCLWRQAVALSEAGE